MPATMSAEEILSTIKHVAGVARAIADKDPDNEINEYVALAMEQLYTVLTED